MQKILDIGKIDLTDATLDERHKSVMDFFKNGHNALSQDGLSYGLIVALPDEHVKLGVGKDPEILMEFARATYPEAIAIEIIELRNIH